MFRAAHEAENSTKRRRRSGKQRISRHSSSHQSSTSTTIGVQLHQSSSINAFHTLECGYPNSWTPKEATVVTPFSTNRSPSLIMQFSSEGSSICPCNLWDKYSSRNMTLRPGSLPLPKYDQDVPIGCRHYISLNIRAGYSPHAGIDPSRGPTTAATSIASFITVPGVATPVGGQTSSDKYMLTG